MRLVRRHPQPGEHARLRMFHVCSFMEPTSMQARRSSRPAPALPSAPPDGADPCPGTAPSQPRTEVGGGRILPEIRVMFRVLPHANGVESSAYGELAPFGRD